MTDTPDTSNVVPITEAKNKKANRSKNDKLSRIIDDMLTQVFGDMLEGEEEDTTDIPPSKNTINAYIKTDYCSTHDITTIEFKINFGSRLREVPDSSINSVCENMLDEIYALKQASERGEDIDG